jgi:hypothetical protein
MAGLKKIPDRLLTAIRPYAANLQHATHDWKHARRLSRKGRMIRKEYAVAEHNYAIAESGLASTLARPGITRTTLARARSAFLQNDPILHCGDLLLPSYARGPKPIKQVMRFSGWDTVFSPQMTPSVADANLETLTVTMDEFHADKDAVLQSAAACQEIKQ